MGRYPQAFSYTYCQMVKASEQAGSLEAGLRQVASHMEKQMEAAKKIGRALAYPGLVLLMSIGVFVFMVTVALPPLVKLFTSLGARLPWTTSLVISTATFLIDYRLYLLVGLAGLVVAAAIYLRLPAGKLAMDRLMLRLPVLGSITLEHYLYRWCQSTAMMLKAGLPLPQIMDIVLPTVRNRIVHQALVEVGEGVIGGRALSQSMAATGLFPSLLVEMLAVGEKTGNLDATIETLANFYEQKVDRRVDALTAMIEPVLTIAIGLVVAFIALSMITPLYSVLQSFR